MEEWIAIAVIAGLVFIPLALGSLISHIKDIAPSTQRKNQELEEKTKEYEKARLELAENLQKEYKELETKLINECAEKEKQLNNQRGTLYKQFREAEERLQKAQAEKETQISNKERHLDHLITENKRMHESLEARSKDFQNELQSLIDNQKQYYPQLATAMADLLTVHYDQIADYLKIKRNPAYDEAYRIKKLREETKGIIAEKKELEYLVAYLCLTNPDVMSFLSAYQTANEQTKISVHRYIAEHGDKMQVDVTELKKLQSDLANYETRLQTRLGVCFGHHRVRRFHDSLTAKNLPKVLADTFSFHSHVDLTCKIKSDNEIYVTTLDSCTCKSFEFGHAPCKHMIWLAANLGLLALDHDQHKVILTDINTLKRFEEHIANEKDRLLSEKKAQETWIAKEKEKLESKQKFIEDQSQAYPWLASLLARYNEEIDILRLRKLNIKAYKAAETVKLVKAEKNAAITELNLLKSQLTVYENLFPWLEEFKTLPVDEAAKYALASASNEDYTAALRKWLSPEEYAKLSPAEKSQLALERYMKREKTDWEVGVEYERYIGYLYELDGYSVKYTGATQGLTDMGRDLVAEKDGIVRIIQCKRWSSDKTIHEKHIFQLFGTTFVMRVSDSTKEYKGIFYTSTNLSPLAAECASQLGIEVHQSCKMEDYPVIKCNIGHDEYGNPEKIYHLPFDQQYDRVVIEPSKGEFYAHTVQEAENAGFRHAYKWMGA